MYQLLSGRSLKALSVHALPPFLLALLTAELFFKWHSFVLECAGFLATWYVAEWLWTRIVGRGEGDAVPRG